MKRKFTFLIAAAVMLLTMMATTGTMWGQTKITDYNNIVSGKTYYIGATNGSGTDYYLYVNHTNNSTSTAGTAQTDPNDASTFLFEGSGTTWTIKFDNGKYLSLKDTKDNGKVQVIDANTTPAPTFTASNQGSKLRLSKGDFSIQKNNSGTQFGSYGNTQTDIWLMEVSTGPTKLSTPTNFAATPGNAQATFTWTAVEHASSYTISYTPNGGAEQTVANITGTSKTIEGLTNDTEYTCKIKAVGDGEDYSDSDYSSTITVTPTTTTYEWVPVAIGDLTAEDIFVIVGTNSGTFAMTNDNGTGSAPTATSVTIEGNKLTSVVADNMKWNISGNSTDGYTFYPNGSATTWLYCNTNSGSGNNNNMRVGTGDRKVFKHNASDYLLTNDNYTDRYVCVYSGQDWRGYTSASTTIAYYKRTIQAAVETPTFSVATGTYNTNQSVTITCATDGATIYYTTDGSIPSNSSTQYTEVVSITQTTTLKAIAIKGDDSSNVASATYTMKCATPTFSPVGGAYTSVQNVTITSTEGSSIYYTLDGTTPTNASTLYEGPVSISETKTLKAIAIKNNWTDSDVATAEYTIDLPLTTMDEIYAKAVAVGSIATNVNITFNNWVISGVNGSTAYLTDGTKGCIIYQSGHGFDVGNILSGTAQCQVVLYHNAAEIKGLKYNTTGLTVTTGGTINPTSTTIAELSAINTSSVFTIRDLEYDETDDMLSDGVNEIKLKDGLYNFSNDVEDGKKYHITGVFVIYDSQKQIYPRNEVDIVLAADMSATDFSSLTAFSYVVNNGPSAAQNVGIDGSDFAGNLTITASSDYEICTTENGTYTSSIEVEQEQGEIAETLYIRLKAGLATGEHNGTLTFTATNLTTIVENVAGAVTATQNYNVLLDDQITNGTISANPILAEAGATITLSATPDPCYQFVEWVTLPDDLTWTSANQFTMPAEDVIISATFSQITYTVQYSVNGVVKPALQETVGCGEDASLWDEAHLNSIGITLPTGLSLLGWSTTEGSTETVSSFEPDADATLYAVLAGEATYNLVTNVSELSAGDVIVIAASGYNFAMSQTQNTNNRDQAAITKAGNSITWTNEAKVCEFVLGAGTKNNTWSFYDGGTSKGYIYAASSSSNNLKTEGTLSDNSSWTISISNGVATITAQGSNTRNVLQYNNSSSIFSCYGSASQKAISLYKKDEPAFNTITEVSVTTTIDDNIPTTTCVIVENGAVLTFNGENQGTAANLIIEDGGQLIHNGNVTATLKKNVAGYNTRSVSGWYTIASPVADMDVNCATTGTYDFFAFNEENTKWLNQKVAANNITNFEQGVGYLYANADATVVNYLGTLIGTETEVTKPLSYACENASYQGINLMGNPFSRNLVAGDIEIASTPLTTYYTVEGGNELTAKTLASTPIKPGQGFMVQATASSQNLVFNPTSKDRSAAKVGYISIVAGNSEFTDNAFVQVGGGNTLHKMTLSDNSSIVYVMNNGNDYAAATIDALEGSMPVCFKANALGSYTITIEAIDINADYLHLIDNFTGEDINLLLEPSYSFIASNGDRAERFTLVFRSNGSEGTTNDIFAYQNGSDIIVNGEGELQVFDVTGRMVATQHVNGVQTVNVPSQGVFIFKLNEKTQKIVVR